MNSTPLLKLYFAVSVFPLPFFVFLKHAKLWFLFVFRSCTISKSLPQEVRILLQTLLLNTFFLIQVFLVCMHADSSLFWLTSSIRQLRACALAGGFNNIKSTLEVFTDFKDFKCSKTSRSYTFTGSHFHNVPCHLKLFLWNSFYVTFM